jgi:hypothetical protein
VSWLRKISHNLDRAIKSSLKTCCPRAKEVPNLRARKMRVVDVVNLDFCHWVGKVKFLVQTTISINIPANLLFHVKLTPIYLVGDSGSKMLQTVHPGKGVATQVHIRQVSLLFLSYT